MLNCQIIVYRRKSPHGITRENLSHTAPLYSYFARILERIKKRGKLGKVLHFPHLMLGDLIHIRLTLDALASLLFPGIQEGGFELSIHNSLSKVWILCDTGLHGDNVVDSLKKDYNAQIHGGSHHQDHYLGR